MFDIKEYIENKEKEEERRIEFKNWATSQRSRRDAEFATFASDLEVYARRIEKARDIDEDIKSLAMQAIMVAYTLRMSENEAISFVRKVLTNK